MHNVYLVGLRHQTGTALQPHQLLVGALKHRVNAGYVQQIKARLQATCLEEHGERDIGQFKSGCEMLDLPEQNS